MAIVLKERPNSRRIRYGASGGGETLIFNGRGSDDSAAIYAAVLAIPAPAPGGPVWDGFIRQDIEVGLLGGGRSEVTVEYGVYGAGGSTSPVGTTPVDPTPPAGGSDQPDSDTTALDSGYSLTISNETVHITQARKLVSSGKVGGGQAPDVKLAIGVHKDGNESRVEGTDILSPKVEWTRQAVRALTTQYQKKLEDLVGKKNTATFYNRPAGEQLYLGCTATPTSGGLYQFTHNFASRRNRTDIILVPDADDPTNPATAPLKVASMKGWDYLDVAYKNEVADDEVAPRPFAYRVYEVYPDGNFGDIGIGQ